MARPRSGGGVLFVFLDGVGLGEEDEAVNPFARAWARGVVPTLHELVGGALPSLHHPRIRHDGSRVFPLDARLGVPGTPQSGTGQAALLTGVNAASLHGEHFGPWTPVALRPLVEEGSLLRTARDAGRSVAFANAYPRGWPGGRARRRVAGPPLAARGAGLLHRHEEALEAGEAVSSEIVNDAWIHHLGHRNLPRISPTEAGRILGRIAAGADLTLYAHYATDTVGHRGSMDDAVAALTTVDAFLAGVLETLPTGHTLLVASDHGNLEDVRVGHTHNPALALARGPASAAWSERMESLLDVTPAVLDHLGVDY